MNGQQISYPVGISNAFNEHFTNTQQTNISVTDCIDLNEQDAHLVNFIKSHISEATVFHIPPITTQQVIEDLKSIPSNKATGLDGIGIKPLKLALNAIAPSLTHILNSSIASGIFPNNFKQAKLTPVYKKDSVHDRNNYRPISILPITSKPLERHVAKSYHGYLTSNNLIHRHQSAYRPHHSCETALLNLTDNWLKAMDSRKLVGSVLLDLSKAFDLVDHDLLLSKIDKYHVTNTSQEWFQSYLSNRTQRCYINGSLSDALVLARGVPQGSILGPILFLLYINDLPIGIPNSNVDIYADDTTICETNSDPLLIQRGLQDSLDRTSSWLSLNKMVPNTKKTKYLIIGTVQKLLHSGNIS